MFFATFLWLFVWGGMFTGLDALRSSALFSNPLTFIQGIRSLFPLLVVYVVLIWILASKSRYPFIQNPLNFLFLYCLLGLVVSIFLSPNPMAALYWATLYLSPIFVMWFVLEQGNSMDLLRRLVIINSGIFVVITIMLIPDSIRGGSLALSHDRLYSLPFNLGVLRANGVGRFALVSVIISAVQFFSSRDKRRFMWLGLIAPSLYILARTQSRTALLGFAVVCVLFFLIMHVDWRMILAGPLAAYIIWVSGVEWRAQGRMENLVDLTGRELTWQRAVTQISQSPFIGWGFHADRLLLNSEHMHNSYLHSMIHAGLVGTLFFIAAFFSLWVLVVKHRLLERIRFVRGRDQPLLIESVLFLGFMTSRSFFESTGAFYGVDLLLIVPSMVFIHLWAVNNPDSKASS